MHASWLFHFAVFFIILWYLKSAPGKLLLFIFYIFKRGLTMLYANADWAGSVSDERSTYTNASFRKVI